MAQASLFNPFGSLPRYEDRLTWAFLVVLAYDPHLRNFVRELVESRLPLRSTQSRQPWEPARVSTQSRGIDSSTNRLVSVLLTDTCIPEVKVKWSDRIAVYDGVIEYPDGLTYIVENKPSHGHVSEEQLSPSRASFSGEIDDVLLHDSAICVEWSEVLEGFLKYTESNIPSFGSREIARDFLSFVEEVHPGLTPYRTFRLCGDRHEALYRRTMSLIASIERSTDLESRGQYLFRPGAIAERVFIEIPKKEQKEPFRLRVSLYPASTASQADRFKAVNRENFLSLGSQGWKVVPNLNFSSFPQGKLIWVERDWEPLEDRKTREYLDYFYSGEKRLYGRKRWSELGTLIEEWECQGIINSAKRKEVESIRGTYQSLDVNPEFLVFQEWDLDTVIELEEKGETRGMYH